MILGFTGKKRCGKDTAVKYLVKKGWTRYALADPMKEAVKEIFLMDDEQLWGEDKEIVDARYGVTPRKILQILGTELFQYDIYRHLPKLSVKRRELWINRFKLWYDKQIGATPVHSIDKRYVAFLKNTAKYLDVAISDVRFPHEAEVIREMNGLIVKIVRTSNETKDSHASETEIDEIHPDYIIYNDGTIKDLERGLDNMLNLVGRLKKDESI